MDSDSHHRNLKRLYSKIKPYINRITPTVGAKGLFKLTNRNRTRLVGKPSWTRLRGRSENVYSGTRTFCLFDRRRTGKSAYRSSHFHFCPSISSNSASLPISSDFVFLLKISRSSGLPNPHTLRPKTVKQQYSS
jgi:hypothetical protein